MIDSPSMTKIVASVIVPCYNHGQFLEEALRSVLQQTFDDWECIVVDNGSTDNSKEVADKFIAVDKRFIYAYQENKGVSSARNKGISLSSGKYILPLDADDKIGKHYLKEAITAIESDPSIKIVYCDAELFGVLKGRWKLQPFSIKNILMENVIFCSALYKRSDFDKTNGYKETMITGFEDWDFWLEMLKQGGDVYKIPSVNFYYRVRKESRNGRLSKEEIRLLRKDIYKNHKALYEKYFDVPDALFEWFIKKECLDKIEFSGEYRFGKIVLRPLRKLKTIFSPK